MQLPNIILLRVTDCFSPVRHCEEVYYGTDQNEYLRCGDTSTARYCVDFSDTESARMALILGTGTTVAAEKEVAVVLTAVADVAVVAAVSVLVTVAVVATVAVVTTVVIVATVVVVVATVATFNVVAVVATGMIVVAATVVAAGVVAVTAVVEAAGLEADVASSLTIRVSPTMMANGTFAAGESVSVVPLLPQTAKYCCSCC